MGEIGGPFWEVLPLEALDQGQWEALCDGCGKCCIHKLEDEETGDLYPTNVACKMLNRREGQCRDYGNRHAHVPECITLTPKLAREIEWLPSSCSYVLRAEGKPLPDWHYLVCGDREAIHRAGQSVRGWTVSEEDVINLEDHLLGGHD
jgi:uncharacterized cysteine cluster protein YcgN (CxxCxxCC family)